VQSSPRHTPLYPWVLAAVSAALVLFPSPAVAQFGGPQPVAVAEVERKEILAERSFVGTIEPYRETVIGSAVEGRMIELFAREGDLIPKGEPLAQLRTKTIEIELAAAEAELRLRQSTLQELKNGSRPEEIEQARARVAGAQAEQLYQQANLRRLTRLRETSRSVVTDDAIEQATAQAEQARQLLLEAQSALALAEQGPRAERIAQAQASVDFQQQQVLQLEDRLDKHTVRAPFDGYVTEEQAEAGRWMQQGDPIAAMVDLSLVNVVVELPEQYIAQVRGGGPARVRVDALPEVQVDATVSRIVPLAARQGRTFPIKVQLQNRLDAQGQPLFMGGMIARVALPLGEPRPSLVVPKDALVLGGASPNLMVVVPSSEKADQLTVASVPVRTGIASGNEIEVMGDVQPGDRVVVRGNERLRPGMIVQVME
jgi:RND family efflux transporter MFP subunit